MRACVCVLCVRVRAFACVRACYGVLVLAVLLVGVHVHLQKELIVRSAAAASHSHG